VKKLVAGVRLPGDDVYDQKAVADPNLIKNVDFAVVGRPILTAPDPVDMVKRYKEALTIN